MQWLVKRNLIIENSSKQLIQKCQAEGKKSVEPLECHIKESFKVRVECDIFFGWYVNITPNKTTSGYFGLDWGQKSWLAHLGSRHITSTNVQICCGKSAKGHQELNPSIFKAVQSCYSSTVYPHGPSLGLSSSPSFCSATLSLPAPLHATTSMKSTALLAQEAPPIGLQKCSAAFVLTQAQYHLWPCYLATLGCWQANDLLRPHPNLWQYEQSARTDDPNVQQLLLFFFFFGAVYWTLQVKLG